ncbi:MAG: IS481 family transposase [Methylocella sp.]
MDIHKNARLTPIGRERIVMQVASGQTPQAAARAAGVCPRTVRKWVARYAAEGVAGLAGRSSRPRRLNRPTPLHIVARIGELRRQRLSGKHIAASAGVSAATVSRVLKRMGLNRRRDLEPAEPVRRYEREHPGELIHLDIKKLGRFERIGHRITGDRKGQGNARGVGWEFVHVAIDDASRIAFTRIKPDERAVSAVAFLKAAIVYYASLGVKVARVMTGNGSAYRSFAFARACRRLKIKHLRTKPYTPKTNGKAERFIQTALREWAKLARGSSRRSLLEWSAEGYARAYRTSDQRAQELPVWTHQYNWHRPHGGLKSNPPISRLGLSEDTLLRLHS